MTIIEKKKIFECEFEGKKIIFEVDKLGIKGNKSVVCRYGDTVVLTVLTIKANSRDNFSFFPLTVSFEEKFYAVGRIPGSIGRREAKPSNFALVAARIIDRSLRSFFPNRVAEIDHEVQITNLVLSVGKECNPLLAALWSSFLVCFLSSDLYYFDKCFSSLIVGRNKGGELVFHLDYEELVSLPLELIVSATEEKIIAMEMGAAEIVEGELEKIVEIVHLKIKDLIKFFNNIFETLKINKIKKNVKEDHYSTIIFEKKAIIARIREEINSSDSWWEKEKKINLYQKNLIEDYCLTNNLFLERKKVEVFLGEIFDDIFKEEAQEMLLKKNMRLDGRQGTKIRDLAIKINYLPTTVVHGSSLFQRGNTQVLSVVTFGKASEKQMIDNSLFPSGSGKHFIHHYNFPGFSVNNISHSSALSRRAIGHGELVEKTFSRLFPPLKTFPYTTRVVSEVMSSDGSSSQASICATSLALISSGVSSIRPVAGVALGLLSNHILTDINALEDRISEMDFKIAGTENGICSIQLDIKEKGLTLAIFKESLNRAKQARLLILDEMKKHISSVKSVLPDNVAKWRSLYVGNEKMRMVIGSGGRVINELIKRTGASFDVQPNGYLLIYHSSEEKLEGVCLEIVKLIGKNER